MRLSRARQNDPTLRLEDMELGKAQRLGSACYPLIHGDVVRFMGALIKILTNMVTALLLHESKFPARGIITNRAWPDTALRIAYVIPFPVFSAATISFPKTLFA